MKDEVGCPARTLENLKENGQGSRAVRDTRLIGSELALHVRQDYGAKAYDIGRFRFAHAGRIYEVTTLRADNEDRSVQDRFLDCFRFQ